MGVMGRKLARLVLFAMLAHGTHVFAAEDYVLWFMVDESAQIGGTSARTYVSDDGFSVNAARVSATVGGDTVYLNLIQFDEETGKLDYESLGQTATFPSDDIMTEYGLEWETGVTLGSLLDGSAGSLDYNQFVFAIELGYLGDDDSWTKLAVSDSESFAALQDSYISAVEDGIVPGMKTAWAPTVYSPVPEPSGGVLLIMGAALLALKRRERQIQPNP